MKTKQEIRKAVQAARLKMTEEEMREKSAAITAKVLQTEAFQKAESVCVYLPIRREVETSAIIDACRKAGKRTAAPRIENGQMEFYYFSSPAELEAGVFGIREPVGREAAAPGALILMPGVAFDRERRRIGYGGGYYDRYLAAHPDNPTIAVAFDRQVTDRIPAEPFDLRPDMLITETNIYTM